MKRFNEYLNEDFDPAIYNHDGGISIDDPTVVEAINSNLEVTTANVFRTPYNGLEEVRKVLEYYKIFLPKSVFLDKTDGHDVFQISQFGEKMGMNNDGEMVTAPPSPLFVYFEWSLNDKGMYDVFAAVVDEAELDEIMDDVEAEMVSDDTDLTEEMSMGAKSKLLYKIVNQAMAEKQSDDVDAYIEHEKQGKTFTQVCEAVMANLKKKMGAKKVTLPNMMRKEESQLDEIADTPKGKEAVRLAVHRADATVVDSAINPPRSKKGKREAKNAMKTIDRGIAVHKKKGGVLDNYLKRSYGIKEEEQLDEISKKRLGSYIKQASDDKATAAADHHLSKKKKGSVARELEADNLKRYQKRDKGIKMAVNKLTKEEAINEVSKKTLASYIKKASHDVATKSAATGRYADRANRARDEMKKGDYKNWPQGKKDDEFADKMFKKSWNRRKGIAKAADKLAKD